MARAEGLEWLAHVTGLPDLDKTAAAKARDKARMRWKDSLPAYTS